jgi:hypothetical protein
MRENVEIPITEKSLHQTQSVREWSRVMFDIREGGVWSRSRQFGKAGRIPASPGEVVPTGPSRAHHKNIIMNAP